MDLCDKQQGVLSFLCDLCRFANSGENRLTAQQWQFKKISKRHIETAQRGREKLQRKIKMISLGCI